MRYFHLGMYGVPGIGIPGQLPPIDGPAPETAARDALCKMMLRIKAAGFDGVIPETRTPAMVDAWMQPVKRAAEQAKLAFGCGWAMHDMASAIWPEWCAAPNYGNDAKHPRLRSDVMAEAGASSGITITHAPNSTISRLDRFSPLILLNCEYLFSACRDFPAAWGTTYGHKLGEWFASMAKSGRQVFWFHPDGNQGSASLFELEAYAACYKACGGARYCRTAGAALNNDALFRNHRIASGRSWDLTSEMWKLLPETTVNPAILSVAWDRADAVLRDMGV